VNRKTGVTSDHVIEVTSRGKTLRLRRVGYRDAETGKRYAFLTNHFRLSVQQIFQLITLNLLGTSSLEELLNPRLRNNENSNNLSLLQWAA
jgi:hypothetical protein